MADRALPAEASKLDMRPELRELVHERLGFIRIYAEAGQLLCGAADDTMLECTIRKLIAYTKAAANDFIDIRKEYERLASPDREAA